MRRNDVASTSFRRHVPTRFLINQCQIITFLILKYDIIENSRIESRGIVLPVQVGGLLGGPKGMLAPPLKLLGGPGPPSSYAYDPTHPQLQSDSGYSSGGTSPSLSPKEVRHDINTSQTRDVSTTFTQRCPNVNVHDVWTALGRRCNNVAYSLRVVLLARH